jgi:DNA polymerase-4
VGELAALPRADVLERFGSSGAWIHDLAHGIDPRRVSPRREEKSYSIERTFVHDVTDREELRLKLFAQCEELAYRLRSAGLRGRTVTLKARYWNFKTVTRRRTLPFPTNLGPRIWAAARALLGRVPPGPLRLIGVAVSGLEDVRVPLQGQLFGRAEPAEPAEEGTDPADAELERATVGLDRLREKYGPGTVVPASLLGRA